METIILFNVIPRVSVQAQTNESWIGCDCTDKLTLKVLISFLRVKEVALSHHKINVARSLKQSPELCWCEICLHCLTLCFIVGRIITAESQQHMAVGWGEENQMRTKAQVQK